MGRLLCHTSGVALSHNSFPVSSTFVPLVQNLFTSAFLSLYYYPTLFVFQGCRHKTLQTFESQRVKTGPKHQTYHVPVFFST